MSTRSGSGHVDPFSLEAAARLVVNLLFRAFAGLRQNRGGREVGLVMAAGAALSLAVEIRNCSSGCAIRRRRTCSWRVARVRAVASQAFHPRPRAPGRARAGERCASTESRGHSHRHDSSSAFRTERTQHAARELRDDGPTRNVTASPRNGWDEAPSRDGCEPSAADATARRTLRRTREGPYTDRGQRPGQNAKR